MPVITAAIGVPAALLTGTWSAAAQDLAAATRPEAQIVVSPMVAGIAEAFPPGVGSERGLQVKTILAGRAISARFPEITEIGGVRPDAMRWHPEGLAIDVIIPDYASAAGRELGDRIVAFVFQNATRFGLVHVIWQRTYYPASGSPRLMADLGSADANHYTHVHIATDGGGFPGGGEILVR